MNANTAALLIAVVILIAMMLWVPFLDWCAECMTSRKNGGRPALVDDSEPSVLLGEGVPAAAEGRRW